MVLPGAGISHSLGNGSIALNVNYLKTLNNVVDPTTRYGNSEFILSAQYVDSDFRINTLGFDLSYQVPITYKKRKK
ncbi:MAG: hypothetical protein ACI9UJ_000516 [bacterium]|jgi:hypothetical protein